MWEVLKTVKLLYKRCYLAMPPFYDLQVHVGSDQTPSVSQSAPMQEVLHSMEIWHCGLFNSTKLIPQVQCIIKWLLQQKWAEIVFLLPYTSKIAKNISAYKVLRSQNFWRNFELQLDILFCSFVWWVIQITGLLPYTIVQTNSIILSN